ncbi:MAG: DUF697 domain-containing protein [Coleofasciculaceae cyanobacterium]
MKLRRPILIGGVGISFSLWLLQSFQQSVADFGEFSILGLVALGAGFWWLSPKKSQQGEQPSVLLSIDRETAQKAIAQAEHTLNQLETEINNQDAIAPLRERVTLLTAELDRQELQFAIAAGKGLAKNNLRQLLESEWLSGQHNISLQEAPALLVGIEANLDAEKIAKEITLATDLVIFVTAGDLTESQLQILRQLSAAFQRIILVFNNLDQYLPTDRVTILQQLRQRVAAILRAEDVVGAASNPAPVKVRQHQPDGSVQEWMEAQTTELTNLTERLNYILAEERQQLVWATTRRKAAAIKDSAKNVLNTVRHERALPVIEQYQWVAAAAAFANPVPALDLLATAAISGQLVIDLGEIYQQKFSLEQAQTAAKTLGSLMVKLGLVEISTQTIGSILKGHAFTYLAGGAVQGVSAAYLTRLAGLSLIEYFQEQEASTRENGQAFNLERLGQKMQKVFKQNQRTAFLKSFVTKALENGKWKVEL